MLRIFKFFFILIVLSKGTFVFSQESKPDNISRDWSTFFNGCYIVSAAIKMEAFKNGERLTKVSRDKGRFYIKFNKESSGPYEGTYFAGFPLKIGSQAKLIIDNNKTFLLYSHPKPSNSIEKNYAWTHPNEDIKIINSLKSGTKAIIESNSHTGKVIKDTFALTGFTKSFKILENNCN
jgi:hypothetical protein